MPQQVLVIHGGTSFKTYEDYFSYLKNKRIDLDKLRYRRWKDNLREDLGEKYDVLLPTMPNSKNANYKEWKILFEKILERLNDNIILVGHSLGGIFLAAYLSENKIDKKIVATILVAAPFKDEIKGESLKKFALPKSLDLFSKQSKVIYLLHSKDDPVVPFNHIKEYKKQLPSAVIKVFTKKGHFSQKHFSEIVQIIKDIKRGSSS